jgi:glycosyltransferase involved in cell wall biosynthesis
MQNYIKYTVMPSHKILHIFASATWGGGEQYIFDLAKKQIENGHRVTLVAGSSEVIREKVMALQCPYFTIKHRWHFNPFSIGRLRRIILQEKIDIVHVHLFKDAFIAAFAAKFIASAKRPKIVMTRHLVKKGKRSWIYQWLYSKLDKLIFVSELAKNEFLQGVRLPDSKITAIHNSIPDRTQAIQSIDYRAHFGLSRECLLVGFTGRLVKYKGVELLIDIAENLGDRNMAFFLAGSGDKEYVSFLKKTIGEKKLETRFFLLGFLDNTEAFIAKMDVGLLPSLWREPFGLSILEFMQQGIPVITSNNGAQVEFIEHEKTGLLVNPTVENVTNALIKLLDDKAYREKIGKNAKDFCAKDFSYDRFYNSIMQVYNS